MSKDMHTGDDNCGQVVINININCCKKCKDHHKEDEHKDDDDKHHHCDDEKQDIVVVANAGNMLDSLKGK